MTYSPSLADLRDALDWLDDAADLGHADDARAVLVLATLLTEALTPFHETAQRAADIAADAGAVVFFPRDSFTKHVSDDSEAAV